MSWLQLACWKPPNSALLPAGRPFREVMSRCHVLFGHGKGRALLGTYAGLTGPRQNARSLGWTVVAITLVMRLTESNLLLVVLGAVLLGGCAPREYPLKSTLPSDPSAPGEGDSTTTVHSGTGMAASTQPTDENVPVERFRAAIEELPSNGVAERTASFDIAYPSTQEEYDDLAGWTIVLVTALSRDERELPLRRVYSRLNDREVDLQSAAERRIELTPSQSDVADAFGKYRFDGLYYFPVLLTRVPTEIVIDFNRTRTGFVVGQFPPRHNQDALPPGLELGDDLGTPNPVAVHALVEKEFPFFAPRKSSAHE
jgi:hypothetical protein